MRLHLQPNSWTCGICTYAMCMDTDPRQLIKIIGHNGDTIINPDGADITKKLAGFTSSELNLAAWRLGWTCTEFYPRPTELERALFSEIFPEPAALIEQFDEGQRFAVLIASRNFEGSYHYVAYEKGQKVCYDPQEGIIPFRDLSHLVLITAFSRRLQ